MVKKLSTTPPATGRTSPFCAARTPPTPSTPSIALRASTPGTAQRRIAGDIGQLVLRFDQTQKITNRYLWGPAVDQILADEQISWNDVAEEYDIESILWPLTDHRGTIRDLAEVNGSGVTEIVNTRTYDAYGKVIAESAPAVDHIFGFTARPSEGETDLQNNLNRWYDAAIGTWINEDLIGFEGGDANLYRYCGNDPVNSVDPSGLQGGSVRYLPPTSAPFNPPSWITTPVGRALTSTEQRFLSFVFKSILDMGLSQEEQILLMGDIASVLNQVRLWDHSTIPVGSGGLSHLGASVFIVPGLAEGVTVGNQIYFTHGAYQRLAADLPLLAHEAFHSLQYQTSRLGVPAWVLVYFGDATVNWMSIKWPEDAYMSTVPEMQAFALQFALRTILQKYPNLPTQIAQSSLSPQQKEAIANEIRKAYHDELVRKMKNHWPPKFKPGNVTVDPTWPY